MPNLRLAITPERVIREMFSHATWLARHGEVESIEDLADELCVYLINRLPPDTGLAYWLTVDETLNGDGALLYIAERNLDILSLPWRLFGGWGLKTLYSGMVRRETFLRARFNRDPGRMGFYQRFGEAWDDLHVERVALDT